MYGEAHSPTRITSTAGAVGNAQSSDASAGVLRVLWTLEDCLPSELPPPNNYRKLCALLLNVSAWIPKMQTAACDT